MHGGRSALPQIVLRPHGAASGVDAAGAASGPPATLRAEMTLVPGDPLAHRALESLLRAEASVRRRLSADLEREGLSATGFSVLVILTTAGGELELRVLRARLRTSKANATEVVTTLEPRGLVDRRRLVSRPPRRAVAITPHGREMVDRLFPEHTRAGGARRSPCSTRPRSASWPRSAASSPPDGLSSRRAARCLPSGARSPASTSLAMAAAARPVDPSSPSPTSSRRCSQRWRERDVFRESLRRREARQPWVF